MSIDRDFEWIAQQGVKDTFATIAQNEGWALWQPARDVLERVKRVPREHLRVAGRRATRKWIRRRLRGYRRMNRRFMAALRRTDATT